jgi:sulfide:quinone oxidoreductase
MSATPCEPTIYDVSPHHHSLIWPSIGPDPEPYGERFEPILAIEEINTRRRTPLRVLIAGGGPAAVELLLALHELAEERVMLELLAPSRDFVYRPLSVVEAFGATAPHRFSIASIARDGGGRHRLGALAAVAASRHRALLGDGSEVPYDALVVAAGATTRPALRGALTFAGEAGLRGFQELLEQIDRGTLRRVVFAVPGAVVWSLPLYELALTTAARCRARGVDGVKVMLVTPEDAPLAIFGRQASRAVASLLADARITTRTGVYPGLFRDEQLALTPGSPIPADAVVALPQLQGPALSGLPHDGAGFIPVDSHGRVEGVQDVYAVGDVTTFPVRQGGIATQQADTVAEVIAAAAGTDVVPRPFRPVLRGLLLTGGPPMYLRAELRGGLGETSRADVEPLWWPPSKIAGRYLSSYLARVLAADWPPTPRPEVDNFEPLLT